MASLRRHGTEIGRVEFMTYSKAYLSDGTVLKNSGLGWKVHGKVKPGITPQQAYENALSKQNAFLSSRPAYAKYRKALHKMTGVNKRGKLHACIELMPGDPDGVWSEVCDGYGDNVHADVNEIAELCRLYEAALSEQKPS